MSKKSPGKQRGVPKTRSAAETTSAPLGVDLMQLKATPETKSWFPFFLSKNFSGTCEIFLPYHLIQDEKM